MTARVLRPIARAGARAGALAHTQIHASKFELVTVLMSPVQFELVTYCVCHQFNLGARSTGDIPCLCQEFGLARTPNTHAQILRTLKSTVQPGSARARSLNCARSKHELVTGRQFKLNW
jgi:hypothetical protein